MSFIYENSCKDKPKFVLDDITSKLYRLEGMSRKEVQRAKLEKSYKTFIDLQEEHVGKVG